MKSITFLVVTIIMILSLPVVAQIKINETNNVGIGGDPDPNVKLKVTGNTTLDGTLKINNYGNSPVSILGKNSNGIISNIGFGPGFSFDGNGNLIFNGGSNGKLWGGFVIVNDSIRLDSIDATNGNLLGSKYLDNVLQRVNFIKMNDSIYVHTNFDNSKDTIIVPLANAALILNIGSDPISNFTSQAIAKCPSLTIAKFDSCNILKQFLFDCITSSWVEFKIGKPIAIDTSTINYVPSISGNTLNLGKFVRSDTSVIIRERNSRRLIDNCGNSLSLSEYKGAIFYVSRPSSGLANSSNPLFVEQLKVARMGDDHAPYPSISSARDAATKAIETGLISKATIWIFSSNYFTFGSTIASENLGEVADEGLHEGSWYNSGTGTSEQYKNSTLIRNNLDYFFEPNSGIINISNTAYTPFFCRTNGVWSNIFPPNLRLESNIFGKGNFTNKNGQQTSVDGTGRFVKYVHSKMYSTFEFESIKFKSFRMFEIGIKNMNIVGNIIETELSNIIDNQTTGIDSASIVVNINTIRDGLKYTDYAVNEPDFWYPFNIGGLSNATINVKIRNFFCNETDRYLFYSGGNNSNSLINVEIENLAQETPGINFWSSVPRSGMAIELDSNNIINYTVKNADSELPFALDLFLKGNNNVINLNSKNWVNHNKRYYNNAPCIFIQYNGPSGGINDTNNLVVISGNFISKNSHCVELNQNSPIGAQETPNVKFLFENCNFKTFKQNENVVYIKGDIKNDNKFFFKNCSFITNGTGKSFFSSDGLPHSVIFLPNNSSNVSTDPLIKQEGVGIYVDPIFKY